MIKSLLFYRLFTLLIISFIIVLGMFRENIIKYINIVLQNNLDESNFPILNNFIHSYGSGKTLTEWISHYLIFYGVYLGCHFSLINLVFRKNLLLKRWVNLALILLLAILILGKIIFGLLNVSILEEYFSFAFHKLVALPFLLLAIEGGRSIYKMIDEH